MITESAAACPAVTDNISEMHLTVSRLLCACYAVHHLVAVSWVVYTSCQLSLSSVGGRAFGQWVGLRQRCDTVSFGSVQVPTAAVSPRSCIALLLLPRLAVQRW